MTGLLADMHIHTYHSDGTMAPQDIVDAAISNGVGLLAITDHNELAGTIELGRICRGYDLQYISGVELDSLDQGLDIHILGYGMDLNDSEFVNFVKRNRLLLDRVNSMLIEKMEPYYDNISYADYIEYRYDRTKGGWKALHYLMDKGLINTLREGFAFYPRYDCGYNKVNFLSVSEVCEYIHRAGGKAVLAHPGVSIKEQDIAIFENEVRRLVSFGADGIECYYPTHSAQITKLCLNICKEKKMLITCGSDCHGDFGNAKVGETKTPTQKLNLGDLYNQN